MIDNKLIDIFYEKHIKKIEKNEGSNKYILESDYINLESNLSFSEKRFI